MMTAEQAILQLRREPQYADLIRDAYLGEDVRDSAGRFQASAEFVEVLTFLGGSLEGARVLDLGAGIGFAAYALAKAGADRVYALEPDGSDVIGRGAIRRLTSGLPVAIVAGTGEEIPLASASVSIVYARQVLHHARHLPRALRECARVLAPGGVLLACREHVVDDEEQLRDFLAQHPVHRLAGGESAHPLDAYVAAIRSAGLRLERTLGPWDSIINAFPQVRTREELKRYPRTLLERRLGPLGALAGRLPPVRWWVRSLLDRPAPGRLYSFLAVKP